MKKSTIRPLLLVGLLLAVTCAAMAYSDKPINPVVTPKAAPPKVIKNGVVSMTGTMTQGKIFMGGDGKAALAIELTADNIMDQGKPKTQNVDMVIVLDRSGSMEGKKINDARQAIIRLLDNLSPKDRFAIVSYSNKVRQHSGLLTANQSNIQALKAAVTSIYPGGGTNLGAGLEAGMDLLHKAPKIGNVGKVVLISDGLANQGVTSPDALGIMASTAVRKEFAVSTVGVGLEFNEHLMTTIADHGTGSYYYLENPAAFARVFQQELHNSKTVAASSIEIRIPLTNGITVVDAAGYPIERTGNEAVFRPGDLTSGQTRKLYVTLKAPTAKEAEYVIQGIRATYRYNGDLYNLALEAPFKIACVKDRNEAYASYDKDQWEKKVIQEDYNKLREDVASSIKKGDKKEAERKIDAYYSKQQAVNAVVGSGRVEENLNEDLGKLRSMVNDSFEGSAAEVQMKQKSNSKAMQHEGYLKRRSK